VNPVIQHREWLIQPEALQSMAASLRGLADPAAFLQKQPAESQLLSIDDGIGVVAIEGPILRKPDIFARIFFGATSSDEIAGALREAAGRDDIKAVFLDIDSPGGTVAGTPELAAAVRDLDKRKPVYAFSSGVMASAAYWIASQARAIYATPSAQVGSIGVVQAVIDNSAALDKAGLKVEVFSVGKYKAMGAPGTPLTDDQRELISSNLAEIARDFHDAVRARGRAIPDEAMEGQTFSGKQAQRFNLAGLVPDRAEAIRRLRVYHASVDTAARAMNTLEDDLAEARSQVANLQRTTRPRPTCSTKPRPPPIRCAVKWNCWPRKSTRSKRSAMTRKTKPPPSSPSAMPPAHRSLPCKPASANSKRRRPISTASCNSKSPASSPPPAPRCPPR